MRHSTNYNLNLVEGSDTFNPLVNDVPNFETIDAAMHANELASIGTATELLSGTVHALTRTNDAPVFRFIATANYSVGDTFTVDGQQVTALLPSGEALASGAYVINSSVICALNGTLLTVFTSGGTIALAADSEKLGGQLPEYYGTAAQTTEAVNTAQAAQTIVNALNANLQASYAGATVPFKFGIDEDGNYGYIKAGADSVTPFRTGSVEPEYMAQVFNVDHPFIAPKAGLYSFALFSSSFTFNNDNTYPVVNSQRLTWTHLGTVPGSSIRDVSLNVHMNEGDRFTINNFYSNTFTLVAFRVGN